MGGMALLLFLTAALLGIVAAILGIGKLNELRFSVVSAPILLKATVVPLPHVSARHFFPRIR